LNDICPSGWRLDSLARSPKSTLPGIPDEVRRVRYPFRLLRYWFAHEALVAEGRRRAGGRLDVAEVGVDAGQMLAYARGTLAHTGLRTPWTRWVALDCMPQWQALRAAGYDEVHSLDLECPADTPVLGPSSVDAIVLLHVLEHLHDPLAALQRVAGWLRPGGMVLAGTPCTPEFARAAWERRLRRRAQPRGHVSVVSPARVRAWGDALGLRTEWLSGAFFARRKGSELENHAWWARANLAFGRCFPSWPGEIYWAWRRPA
jgi:SAM-dependent methyltransferase